MPNILKMIDLIKEVIVEHQGNSFSSDEFIEKENTKIVVQFKPIRPPGEAVVKLKWDNSGEIEEIEKKVRIKGLKG